MNVPLHTVVDAEIPYTTVTVPKDTNVFILYPDTDMFARAAIRRYMAVARKAKPHLCQDLEAMLDRIEAKLQMQTNEQERQVNLLIWSQEENAKA